MYEIEFTQTALKQLEKLDRNMQERIITVLERLRIRPESCDTKKLIGIEGYRLRIGDYRVIYDIKKEKLLILVLKLGHRKNIYDQ